MSKVNFSASQYVTHQMLLSSSELKELFKGATFALLGVLSQDPFLSLDEALNYFNSSKRYKIGVAFSKEPFFIVDTPKGKIATLQKPVIEIKPFSFIISSENDLIEDVHGEEAIYFGISISFPRLFSLNGDISKTKGQSTESLFFDSLRAFKRSKTEPLKFEVGGKRLKTGARVSFAAKKIAESKLKRLVSL